MIFGLILILVILCVNPFSVLAPLRSGSRILHQFCLQTVHSGGYSKAGPEDTAQTGEVLTDIYSALLCGERLPEGELKHTFVALGIIHLMVISGCHLIFLEKMWKNLLPDFRFKNIFLTGFLFIYSLSAGCTPPVLRALFSLLLSRINKKFKLFWSPLCKSVYQRSFMSTVSKLLVSFPIPATQLDSQYGYVQPPFFQTQILYPDFYPHSAHYQQME